MHGQQNIKIYNFIVINILQYLTDLANSNALPWF